MIGKAFFNTLLLEDMLQPMKKLFLFDIDGTLLFTNRAGSRSFLRSCREVLSLVGRVDGVLMAGKLDRVIFQEIAGAFRPDLEAAEIDRYWVQFRKGYVEYLRRESLEPRGWTLLPGVKSLLEFCRSLGRLALLTGNVREGAYIKLSTLGVADYFPTGGFGEELISRGQLAGMAYNQACKHFQTEFPPESTFVIGDTVRDIQAGRSIGARTLAVATGTVDFEELVAAGADLPVKDFDSGAEQVRRFLGS